MEPIEIELSDVQGFLVNEYHDLRHSSYVMLQVTDAGGAKKFLKNVMPDITSVTTAASKTCLNIAFTSSGLRALGLKDTNVNNFIREFREGMVTPHRQRLLGDFDSSDPVNWNWGGPKNADTHIMLLILGVDKPATDNYYATLQSQFAAAGLKEVFRIDGNMLDGNKEHFGFRDAIAQPYMRAKGIKQGKDSDNLNAGEFLMGYKSEYNVYPDTPYISKEAEQGDMSLLEPVKTLSHNDNGYGHKDLGRNGTYLVLRQLQQDVAGYWTFINDHAKNDDGTVNEQASKKLASKMMGRWPSGAPIIKYHDADPADVHPELDPNTYINDNDFMYNYNTDINNNDKHGMLCPFGSHTRRTNPRDSFEENTVKESLILSNRHRIIRRARSYGVPHIASPANFTPQGEVGLLFACFNADISRQFEFIQYTWANYPKFKQLVNDPDPFIGVKEKPDAGLEQVFTIPGKPVNTYVTGLQRFVTVKGGAYFFYPAIHVIKYLTTI